MRSQEQFDEFGVKANILVLGDSHAINGIKPSLLPDAFNFASTGENYIQTYYKLQTILVSIDADVDMIIVPVDLHGFSSFRSNRFEYTYFWKNYIDYLELGWEKGNPLYYVGLRFLDYFPYLSGFDDTMTVLKMRKPAVMEYGYLIEAEKNFAETENPRDLAQERADYHLQGSVILDPDLVEYFQRLLDLAQAHDLQVVLVHMPVTEEYYISAGQYLDPKAFHGQVVAMVGSRENVVLGDYQTVYFGQNDLFADADHLNDDGAERFTILIKNDLLKMR